MGFKLVVISLPEIFPAEAEQVTALFRSGLEIFHLRKPGCSKGKLKEFLRAIPSPFHPRIVIHSHYSLADEFGLRGIHFSEKERKKEKGTRIPGKKYSASLHSLVDIFLCRSQFDYVFISPVFDSISKKGLGSKFELEILSRFLGEYSTLPGNNAEVIALGGVSEKNILQLKKAGFQGAAVLGSVWKSGDPVKNFRKLRSKVR